MLTMIFVNIKHIKGKRCPGNKFDCYVVFIKFIINQGMYNITDKHTEKTLP